METRSSSSSTTTNTTNQSRSGGIVAASRWSSILIPSVFFVFVTSLHSLYTSQVLISSTLGTFGDNHNPNHYHNNTRTTTFSSSPPIEHEPLNVIVLYPDDWRHDTLGLAQQQQPQQQQSSSSDHNSSSFVVHTPFLNSLAEAGIRFTYNCVTTSVCWISRATLFTGQYASEHESFRLYCPNFVKRDVWKNQTWPGIMREMGNYFVGHVGKWQYHHDPCKHGFDFCSLFEGRHWYQHQGERLSGSALAEREAVRFLRERPPDQRFALTVAFYPPKAVGSSYEPGEQWDPDPTNRARYDNSTVPTPDYNTTAAYLALPKFLQHGAARGRWTERYRTPTHYQASMKNYYALVSQVDEACRGIVAEVRRQGLWNTTMVVFTTDNGMFHGAHGLAGKWYPYQESIRVPLIIHDPRMSPDKIGTTDDSLTLNIDLAETILGAAGIEPPPSMQGRDISDLYLSPRTTPTRPWRDEFFYEFDINDNGIPASTALVRKSHKYIRWARRQYDQMFDLIKDPLELQDVKNHPAYAPTLKNMTTRHDEWKRLVQKRNESDRLGGCNRNDNYS